MNNLNLNAAIINKENLEEKLFELLEPLDADLVGDNGPEFVSDKALNNGYESDLDYFIDQAKEEKDSLKDIVEYVLTKASIYWEHFYHSTETSIIEYDNQVFVSVAVSIFG